MLRFTMSKQTAILDFFKGNTVKRPCTFENVCEKKAKVSNAYELEIDNSKENISDVKKSLTLLKNDLPVLDINIGASWYQALKSEFSKPYFKKLSDFVTTERQLHKVYPEECNVWSWTRMCSLSDVKVVIIGQDPYHNPGQAHGLCFSVQRGVSPPPSLLNIYKELKNDIPGFTPPGHGDLTKWAKQGILLLNASLTVRQNSPNSHADNGWEKLTDAVIKCVSDRNSNVVFLLWGSFAQKKAAHVDKKRHHLLTSVHPSPLAASRGFFGCKHFSKCNEILRNAGKLPIDWNLA